jgi:hypothetical protein
VPLARRRAIYRTLFQLAAAGVLLAGTVACRDGAAAFGPTPLAARANAVDLFQAHAERFTDVVRTPKFYAARGKLGRGALTPSKIFGDTSVWTAAGADSSRTLTVQGAFRDGHYVFDARPAIAIPERLGESRHTMRLKQLGDGEYEWQTGVEMAVGTMRAEDASNVLSGLLSSAVGRDEPALRADYRAAFPKTAAALGRLYTLDSLRGTPFRDGTTGITVVATLQPDRLRQYFPAFADYVDKYVVPARARFTLRDRVGARWVDGTIGENRLVLRLRTDNGRMAPLDGAARPMPDELQLHAEVSTKVSFFTVGMRDLVADFEVIRTAHERGWLMRFQREPDWQLPLATRQLLRSPLRRPFEKGGSTVRISLLDRPDAQTLVTRYTRGAVRESAILRFLNSLSSRMVGDFSGKSEAEENRFTAELFAALRDDMRALPSAGASGPAAGLGSGSVQGPGRR